MNFQMCLMTWNGLQTHIWHNLHSLSSITNNIYGFGRLFAPSFFCPSIFVFTCPNDGWTGLYIKLWFTHPLGGASGMKFDLSAQNWSLECCVIVDDSSRNRIVSGTWQSKKLSQLLALTRCSAGESRLVTYGCLLLIDESAHVVSCMMSLNVTVGHPVQTVTVTCTRYCTTGDVINVGQ